MLNTTFYHKGHGLIPAGKLKSFSEWYQDVAMTVTVLENDSEARPQVPIRQVVTATLCSLDGRISGEKSGTKDSFSII